MSKNVCGFVAFMQRARQLVVLAGRVRKNSLYCHAATRKRRILHNTFRSSMTNNNIQTRQARVCLDSSGSFKTVIFDFEYLFYTDFKEIFHPIYTVPVPWEEQANKMHTAWPLEFCSVFISPPLSSSRFITTTLLATANIFYIYNI